MIRNAKNRLVLYSATKIMDYLTYPEEKDIGVKPIWGHVNLPKTWIQRPIKTSLVQARKLMQHKKQYWFGHFFLAGYDKTAAIERFNPNSAYYQAWLGIYLIQNIDRDEIPGFSNETFDLDALAAVGIGDQTSWLKTYRIKNPVVEIKSKKRLKNPKSYHPQAKVAFLGEMKTQSDINPKGATDWRYNQLFGIPNKQWFQRVNPHHELLLRGYYVSWPIKEINTTAIVYGALVANMEDKTGMRINYWNEKKDELRDIIQSISFEYI